MVLVEVVAAVDDFKELKNFAPVVVLAFCGIIGGFVVDKRFGCRGCRDCGTVVVWLVEDISASCTGKEGMIVSSSGLGSVVLPFVVVVVVAAAVSSFEAIVDTCGCDHQVFIV